MVRRPVVGLTLLLLGVAGAVLSTLASLVKNCDSNGCTPWLFEPGWGFWVSLGAIAVLLAALALARRGRRSALVVAVAAALVAVAPVPYGLLVLDGLW